VHDDSHTVFSLHINTNSFSVFVCLNLLLIFIVIEIENTLSHQRDIAGGSEVSEALLAVTGYSFPM
jgi:hypothetical protein